MDNTTYKQLEIEQNGIKVILKFPEQTDEEEAIKKDIREILMSVLQEYIQKIS